MTALDTFIFVTLGIGAALWIVVGMTSIADALREVARAIRENRPK